MNPVDVRLGDGPIVLGMPHAGTWLPDEAAVRLNQTGLALSDTDWWIDRLYEDLLQDVTIVRANFHRYLIDANRDPTGESLYPGQNTTGLCPVTDFDGSPIYLEGREPDGAEVTRRRDAYHRPYHDALATELDRVKTRNGVAILYDCHSIRSHIPFLFDGTLPDLNIGTNGGVTCSPGLERAIVDSAGEAVGYTSVLNARFKGGWTTRHYGRPNEGIHAIQMEIAQSVYMDEAPPWTYRADKADRLRDVLGQMLEKLAAMAPAIGGSA